MRGLKLLIGLAIAGILCIAPSSQALIGSTVYFDIAWSSIPGDMTAWGTPYQTNTGDPTAYDGMFEYGVKNWAPSAASISRFEVKFDLFDATFNPTGRFLVETAILGTPTGWTSSVNSGTGGELRIYAVASPGSEILPGQTLSGFLVDFVLVNPPTYNLNDYIQAYDVYENVDKTGDSDKGFTTPVPEPTTLLLLGTGILAVAGFARRRAKR